MRLFDYLIQEAEIWRLTTKRRVDAAALGPRKNVEKTVGVSIGVFSR